MDDEVSQSFKSISHPIRVQILLMLSKRLNTGYQFSELSRELQIESGGKLAFHLDKMKDLVFVNGEGRYSLTEQGRKAVQAVIILGESENNSNDHENLSKSKVLNQSSKFEDFTSRTSNTTEINRPGRLLRSYKSRYGVYYLIWLISILLITLTNGDPAWIVFAVSFGILFSYLYLTTQQTYIHSRNLIGLVSIITILLFFLGVMLSGGDEIITIVSLIISLLLNVIITIMIKFVQKPKIVPSTETYPVYDEQ